ncbi:MAG: hypothetical protein H7296_04035 [Bacteroidia bacterium]|nr:hypothetical protein [Bacteroidia bacterium]
MKIILLSFFGLLTLITSLFNIKNKEESIKVEYALLVIGQYGAGINKAYVLFENSERMDLEKKFNIKINGSWDIEKNFTAENRAFSILNQKGYKLLSHACSNKNNNTVYTFIFIK